MSVFVMTPAIVPLLSQTTRSALCVPHSSFAASVSKASSWIVTSRSLAIDNILATRIGFVLTGCSPCYLHRSIRRMDRTRTPSFLETRPDRFLLLDENLEAPEPQGVI